MEHKQISGEKNKHDAISLKVGQCGRSCSIGIDVRFSSCFLLPFLLLIFQPIENYSEWRLFYFISFLLLVGFFVLNMFVGVVVENFHKCRESQEQEERARRAAKRAKKLDKKRRSMGDNSSSTESLSAGG